MSGVGDGVAALELDAVEVERGRFRLGPVSFRLGAGERLAVLGPNGSGKSTLLAACAGTLPVAAGRVRIGGGEPTALGRREVARRVAMLRQQPEVAFALPVLDVVLHGRWAHLSGLRFPGAEDVALARRTLERLGLADFEARDVASLSGGERQRAFLARALAQESPLLLLDEPTASQDVHQRVEVHRLLRAAADERRALVVVTHDLDLAAALATRVLLLRDGRVVASGEVTEVMAPEPLREAFRHPIDVIRSSDGSIHVHPRLEGP